MPPVTAIVFILIFFAGCVAALFVDTSFGIFLYIFEYFLHPPGRWWRESIPDLRYALSIGIITVLSFLIWWKRYSENRVFDIPPYKWLLLFCMIIILTWPIAVDQKMHKMFMTVFIKYVFLYYLINKTIDTPKKYERMIGVFLVGQFYLGWIIYQVGRTSGDRVEGMGTADAKDANVLAAIMVVAVPFLIHYIITGKRWQKISALFGAAYILNGIILINSRGAFLAILVSMAYYLLLTMKMPSFPKFSKIKAVGLMICALILFLYLADSAFWDRMETITTPAEAEEEEIAYTGRERVDYWFKTFVILADYPYGVGAMGFEKVSPQYFHTSELSSVTGTRAVHSTYFEAMASYGYHGFLVFMIFLLSNIKYIRKLKKTLLQRKLYDPYLMAVAIESAFIAHLVAAIFINRLYSEILYLNSAFITCYGHIYFKKFEQKDMQDVEIQENAER